MAHPFQRTGALKDLSSYPLWLQRIVRETTPDKLRVVNHELFALMRDARLPDSAMRRFLLGAWPTIEQFPQFMAMSLKKVNFGSSPGEDMARRFLIQNIRVEQKHAEHWMEWARSVDLSLADLRNGADLHGIYALSHWCWYVCHRAPLAVAIAATNYAVEGATGEWACIVCSTSTYADSLPDAVRGPATRWLRMHAEYDDTHPWEALDIIATLLGNAPPPAEIEAVRRAIRTSYGYIEMGLDDSLSVSLHGSFDETASNASTLGALDAA